MKKLDSELKHEVCHWAAFYVSLHSPLFCHCLLQGTCSFLVAHGDFSVHEEFTNVLVNANDTHLNVGTMNALNKQEHRMQQGQKAIFHLEGEVH
jgi:hypothetical protein